MKPTLSPTFGPGGGGGGEGGAAGVAGFVSALEISPVAASASGGDSVVSGFGAGGGAGGCGGGTAAISGWSLRSRSSRYSAVILSSELDATRAAAMPNSLALERTSLLSKPSFFDMS